MWEAPAYASVTVAWFMEQPVQAIDFHSTAAVGARVRRLREAVGLSTPELSEITQISSLSISLAEDGKKPLLPFELQGVAAALGVAVERLKTNVDSAAEHGRDHPHRLALTAEPPYGCEVRPGSEATPASDRKADLRTAARVA